jgi:hypothetical protein
MMKYLVAILLAFGVFTVTQAQTDSPSSDQSFTCYYVDENTFQCDLNKADEGLNEEDMTNEDLSGEGDFGNEGSFGNSDTTSIDQGTGNEREDDTYDHSRNDIYTQPDTESDEGVNESGSDINGRSEDDTYNSDPSVRENESDPGSGQGTDEGVDDGTGADDDPSVNEGGGNDMDY